jgi:hypothetical protein
MEGVTMSILDQVCTHKTAIFTANGMTHVRYHQTSVVSFDSTKIKLDTGGWKTHTTKLRMNQASNQYGLGYRVYQKDFEWYADFKGREIPFDGNGLVLKR